VTKEFPSRLVSQQVRRSSLQANSTRPVFDVQVFLNRPGLQKKQGTFRKDQVLFRQGEAAAHVLYLQHGAVKLTVINPLGKERILEILEAGDFFGVRSLSSGAIYATTATAVSPRAVLVIEKNGMMRVLRAEHELSDRFIASMLKRNMRVEGAPVDRLFNGTEKRLARALLLLAPYDKPGNPQKVLRKVTQETLAEMIGTSRTRVNHFMNKFRKLGFFQYNGEIQINNSLLRVVLHDQAFGSDDSGA
jgi:CRP/FNR family transcriptional regulator, cyclic AMP receptor protein